MDLLNLYTGLYGILHNYGSMPYWIMSPFRRITRRIANKHLPKYLFNPYVRSRNVKEGLIVSLTSFPARINEVWMVVECMKRQTILPERIILWLSKEQFPAKESIPVSLRKEEDDLFQIRMVEEDIRSHKKYYYILQEYPDYSFITCDDDIFYDPHTIERLLSTSENYSGCIIANYTSQIVFDDEGNVKPYKDWKKTKIPYSSFNLLQIGVGGVFYPAHSLHHLTINKELFWQLAPLADDLWLNTMARLNKTPIVQTDFFKQVLPIETNAPSLTSVNNGENMNDKQIKQIRQYLKKNKLTDVYSDQCNVGFNIKN